MAVEEASVYEDETASGVGGERVKGEVRVGAKGGGGVSGISDHRHGFLGKG